MVFALLPFPLREKILAQAALALVPSDLVQSGDLQSVSLCPTNPHESWLVSVQGSRSESWLVSVQGSGSGMSVRLYLSRQDSWLD